MDTKDNLNLPFMYKFVEIPKVVDERGCLCFTENKHLPFEIKRVFWIYGVAEGKTRGGHAHKTCAEIVFPVKGSFEMFVDDGHESNIYLMDSPCKGIYIAPNVWCHLRNFSHDAVCVVLASQEYDAEGYINDYDTFKTLVNGTDTLF